MTYLVLVLITFIALAGFLALVQYEARHETRLFPVQRAKLDTVVERAEFIVAHVDLNAFIREEIHRMTNTAGHTVVHLSLQIVRSVERFLTRLVRRFRARNEDSAVPRETTREFVKTLSDFKDNLKATHPDVSEIE
ncbi:MAG: hypothetical protein ACYC1Y_03295 [Minisyncoccota bacterium]